MSDMKKWDEDESNKVLSYEKTRGNEEVGKQG